MEFTYGLQPALPCGNQVKMQEIIAAWDCYANLTLQSAGFTLSHEVEFVDEFEGELLLRKWVAGTPEIVAKHAEMLEKLGGCAQNSIIVCIGGVASEVQAEALHKAIKARWDGEVYAEKGKAYGTAYATSAQDLRDLLGALAAAHCAT